jgi:hypothetical protein
LICIKLHQSVKLNLLKESKIILYIDFTFSRSIYIIIKFKSFLGMEWSVFYIFRVNYLPIHYLFSYFLLCSAFSFSLWLLCWRWANKIKLLKCLPDDTFPMKRSNSISTLTTDYEEERNSTRISIQFVSWVRLVGDKTKLTLYRLTLAHLNDEMQIL